MKVLHQTSHQLLLAKYVILVHMFYVGLDGWLQIRCPLADYGCDYTTHRFISTSNQTVVYNPAVESFMVKPDICKSVRKRTVQSHLFMFYPMY